MGALPDPNTVGWWALKNGAYVEFCASEKFASVDDAGEYFIDAHGFGVGFHHGNRSGLRPTTTN